MANKRLKSQIQKAKRGGLSMVELARMKAIANKKAMECETVALEKAFVLMLGIPLMLLIEDYWKKAPKRKVSKFINDCASAFDSVQEGVMGYAELVALVKEYADIDIEAEWLKARGE